MAIDISTAVRLIQQPRYLHPTDGHISLAAMGNPRKRVITEADKAAAARLKSLWQAMPVRPTQQQIADGWDGRDGNQSLVSQYMTGRIALNYRAVLNFARMLGVEPEAIRSDLPEQRWTSPHSVQPKLSPEARLLPPSPEMIRDGLTTVSSLFGNHGGTFQVYEDPDLLASAYDFLRTGDPSLLTTIDEEVKDRVQARKGVEHAKEAGKGGRTTRRKRG